MERMKNALKIATIIPFILFLVSCNNRVGNSEESHSLLVLSKLIGKTALGDTADFLQSDVVKIDLTTGQPYVVADTITASVSARLKEPQLVKPGSSYMHNVMLTRYAVAFTLPDGTGSPGTDVPLPFEGSLSTLIEIDSTLEINFVVVTEEAKTIAPLYALRSGGVINARAEVTLYGQDMAGKPVQVTGSISVYFANYIDQ